MTDDRAALVAIVLVALVLVPVLPLNRRSAQETASGILIAALGALGAHLNGAAQEHFNGTAAQRDLA